jgi:hypothetical protein
MREVWGFFLASRYKRGMVRTEPPPGLQPAYTAEAAPVPRFALRAMCPDQKMTDGSQNVTVAATMTNPKPRRIMLFIAEGYKLLADRVEFRKTQKD